MILDARDADGASEDRHPIRLTPKHVLDARGTVERLASYWTYAGDTGLRLGFWRWTG